MSEPLTEAAPDAVAEAFEAPAPVEAVVDDSGSGENKIVPAERFNGLMSKFNKTNEELAIERQYRMELESRLQEFEADNDDARFEETSMTDVGNLQSQVELLTQMLSQQQVNSTRKDILTEFPDIAPFVDLIEAPDPESFRGVAQTLNERVQVIKAAGNGGGVETPVQEFVAESAPIAETAVAPQPDAPVFGGGSGALAPASGSGDRVAEAIRNRDFGAFMRAKTESSDSELTL